MTISEFFTALRNQAYIEAQGIPATDTGSNGDYYCDTLTRKYYRKVGGTWYSASELVLGPVIISLSDDVWATLQAAIAEATTAAANAVTSISNLSATTQNNLNTLLTQAQTAATNAANSATNANTSAESAAAAAAAAVISATNAANNASAANTNLAALDSKLHHPACGRLTLASADPEGNTSVSAGTTLYFAPYNGNDVALYDGTKWANYAFSTLSLALTGLAATTNYDIFLNNNAGTLTLTAVAWSGNNARATALAMQDGIYVKSGAPTYRYLGMIRTTSTAGTCADTLYQRFVWNYYNQRVRRVATYNTNASWTYTTSTAREYNGGTGQVRGEFILGMPQYISGHSGQYASGGSGCIYTFLVYNGSNYNFTQTQYTSGYLVNSLQTGMEVPIGYSYMTQFENGGTSFTVWGSSTYSFFILYN